MACTTVRRACFIFPIKFVQLILLLVVLKTVTQPVREQFGMIFAPPCDENFRSNQLLGALKPACRERISAHLQPTPLSLGDIDCEAGQVLTHAFFPGGSVLSVFLLYNEFGESAFIRKLFVSYSETLLTQAQQTAVVPGGH